jgi:ribonucleotide reductase beta subunit family protein with ferritin-like domain
MNNRKKTRREESIHIDTYNICFDTIWKNEKEKKEIYDSYCKKYLLTVEKYPHIMTCY